MVVVRLVDRIFCKFRPISEGLKTETNANAKKSVEERKANFSTLLSFSKKEKKDHTAQELHRLIQQMFLHKLTAKHSKSRQKKERRLKLSEH